MIGGYRWLSDDRKTSERSREEKKAYTANYLRMKRLYLTASIVAKITARKR